LANSGRSPQRGVSTSGNQNNDDGRDHWPYCYTACVAGAASARLRLRQVGQDCVGAAGKTGRSKNLLATVYHSVGIDPGTIVYNHLNQPRELGRAKLLAAF